MPHLLICGDSDKALKWREKRGIDGPILLLVDNRYYIIKYWREMLILIRNLINWALYVVVFFLFAIVARYISSNQALIMTPAILSDGIIAFFGAFFAFIFLKFADWLSIIRKGNANHFNSLVKIERLLNRTISRLGRSILACRDNIDALSSMKMLVWNLPPVPYNYELADDLKNIDFVNDYFAFTVDIEALNNDLITIMSAYNEIKSLFINRAVSPEIYKDNVAFAIRRVSESIKFMEEFQSEATILLAKARIILKEKKRRIFLIGALPKRNYAKRSERYLAEELIIVKKEIETTNRESQEEIDRITRSKPPVQ
jgi:hypothetical protein